MKNKKILLIVLISILACAIIATACFLHKAMNESREIQQDERPFRKKSADTKEILEVNYEIEREELSFSNKEKNLFLTQYFEKVVITDEGEQFVKINQEIQKQADKFIAAAKENESFVTDSKYMSDSSFSNYHTARVVKNEDGILSIKMVTQWFMGGVHNSDVYGFTFDLKTGEKVTLSDVLDMPKSKAEEYIKDEAKKQLKDGYNSNAAQIIDNYALGDFLFYLYGDEIYLCFQTYKLAPGAAGSITMEIDIPEKD